MQTMNFLCILLLSITVCISSGKKHCCMPIQWEGEEAEVGGSFINQKGVLTQVGMAISYDAINTKLSVISNSTIGSAFTRTWVIQNFQYGVMFTIDLQTKKCVKSNIDFPMESACVPDAAIPGDKVVYGGGSQRITCHTYSWRQTAPGTLVDLFLVVVKDGDVCYPVAEEVVGSANNAPMAETYGFVDLTDGIKDFSIFTPPSYCDQAPMSAYKAKRSYKFLGLYM